MKKIILVLVCTIAVMAMFSSMFSFAETVETTYYWPMEGNANDVSENQFHQDVDGMASDYVNGKVGKAIECNDGIVKTLEFPTDLSISNFSLSFWYKWTGEPNAQSAFQVICALGNKECGAHYELYLYSEDMENAALCDYSTYNGLAHNYLGDGFKVDEWVHIAVTNGDNGVNIYLNGVLAYNQEKMYKLPGFGKYEPTFSLGGLNDGNLLARGSFDEVIFSTTEFSADYVAKLFNDPQGCQDELFTKYNVQLATEVPATDEPIVTEEPAATEETHDATEAPATDAPTTDAPADEKKSGCGSVIGGSAIAVVGLAVLLFKKKK